MNAQATFAKAKTREMSYAEAIREAMALALERDPTVILMGEDIGTYGGAFQVTGDLVDRFGKDRVMDTPISELGGAGVAVGTGDGSTIGAGAKTLVSRSSATTASARFRAPTSRTRCSLNGPSTAIQCRPAPGKSS